MSNGKLLWFSQSFSFPPFVDINGNKSFGVKERLSESDDAQFFSDCLPHVFKKNYRKLSDFDHRIDPYFMYCLVSPGAGSSPDMQMRHSRAKR
jgi:hypothetical protein